MRHRQRHFPTFTRMYHSSTVWFRHRNKWEKFVLEFTVSALVVYLFYLILFAPPAGFPQGIYVSVKSGATLSSISQDFKSKGLIASPKLFDAVARLVGNDRNIPAGVYYFPEPQNLIFIAIRLTSGDFETTPVRVTVPEGATVAQIDQLLDSKMPPTFDSIDFLTRAKGEEGYLFPDTYFFMPGASTDEILSVFNNSFNNHIARIQPQIAAFGKPLPEVLTMASLLEKEANDTQSRRVIAGILWRRLALGMPLQVDAVFPYILNKSALELTSQDLKVDSPYNTYVNKGLPPGPIANPGLDAITDAVTPVKSSYLYYLSDKSGTFHFATTYAQFLVYKQKYLGT